MGRSWPCTMAPTMSARQERPGETQGTGPGKDSEIDIGPADQREARSLQFVLHYAPPDANWETVSEVYREGLDPREVWPDAE